MSRKVEGQWVRLATGDKLIVNGKELAEVLAVRRTLRSYYYRLLIYATGDQKVCKTLLGAYRYCESRCRVVIPAGNKLQKLPVLKS